MYRETRTSCNNCDENGHDHDDSAGSSASCRGHGIPLCRSQSEVVQGGLGSRSSKSGTNGSAAIGERHCLRGKSTVKFGYHQSVPLARSTPGGGGDASISPSSSSTKNVIALVGLPARGKTYISKKLSRYLNWIGVNTRVFNLGEYRRKIAPDYKSHQFFSPDNREGNQLRETVCNEALEDVIQWLETDDGEVAVFDATNTTRKRRAKLYQRLVEEMGYNLFFVESVCDREDIIEGNIREVKVTSPDYVKCDEETVVSDFKARIKHYQDQYETLDEALEPNYSFLKIFNAGEKVLVHKHEGHIQSRIVYYLMNVHITKRTIYLTRHGESHFNLTGQIGGDSKLTDRGRAYSRLLGSYVSNLPHPKLKIWTSWMTRTIETANHMNGVQERWKALNELDVGAYDGLTYAEIKSKSEREFRARDEDKFAFRYARGESYEDLVARLEPVIMELERQDSVMVVAHQAVIRCLLAYYLEATEDELPWLEVPLHTVIELEPVAYGCKVAFIKFPVDCVDTHRKKPLEPGTLEERYAQNIPVLDKRAAFVANATDDDGAEYERLLDHLFIDESLRNQTTNGSEKNGVEEKKKAGNGHA